MSCGGGCGCGCGCDEGGENPPRYSRAQWREWVDQWRERRTDRLWAVGTTGQGKARRLAIAEFAATIGVDPWSLGEWDRWFAAKEAAGGGGQVGLPTFAGSAEAARKRKTEQAAERRRAGARKAARKGRKARRHPDIERGTQLGLDLNPGGEMATQNPSREALIAWLESNDPNGAYSDADAAAGGWAPLTWVEALRLKQDQLGVGAAEARTRNPRGSRNPAREAPFRFPMSRTFDGTRVQVRTRPLEPGNVAASDEDRIYRLTVTDRIDPDPRFEPAILFDGDVPAYEFEELAETGETYSLAGLKPFMRSRVRDLIMREGHRRAKEERPSWWLGNPEHGGAFVLGGEHPDGGIAVLHGNRDIGRIVSGEPHESPGFRFKALYGPRAEALGFPGGAWGPLLASRRAALGWLNRGERATKRNPPTRTIRQIRTPDGKADLPVQWYAVPGVEGVRVHHVVLPTKGKAVKTGEGWQITHRLSGVRLGGEYRTKKAAIAAAKRASKKVSDVPWRWFDWGVLDPESRKTVTRWVTAAGGGR